MGLGAWVEEITDRETHENIWIGSFQLVVLATCEYDIILVCLHGANAQRNFDNGLPQLILVDPRVATLCEMWEDREACGRLEMEQAYEAYMAELRHLYQEHVEQERRLYELYKSGAAAGNDLCSSDADGDGDGGGGGDGVGFGGVSGAGEDAMIESNRERLLNESAGE